MAGAYCKFCDRRCFVYREIIVVGQVLWGGHMATCPAGKAFDLKVAGRNADTAYNPCTPDLRPTQPPIQDQLAATVVRLRDRAEKMVAAGTRQWTGRECVVIVDEAWTVLQDPTLRDMIRTIAQQGRKTSVTAILGFDTDRRQASTLDQFGGDQVIRETAAAGDKPIRVVVAAQLPPLDPASLAAAPQFTDGTWRDVEGRDLFAAIEARVGAVEATRLWREASNLLAADGGR